MAAIEVSTPAPVWVDVPSPTYSGFSLAGGGTLDYKYAKNGKIVSVWGQVTFGSSPGVTGNPVFNLPFTATSANNIPILGNISISGSNSLAVGIINTTTSFFFNVQNAAGTYVSRTGITSTVPNTWASGSYLSFAFTYEAA
jgi:hypothetical protein